MFRSIELEDFLKSIKRWSIYWATFTSCQRKYFYKLYRKDNSSSPSSSFFLNVKKKSKKIKFWTLYTANIIIISFKLLCNLLVLLSFKSVAVNCYHDTLANTWCGSFWLNKTILHKCRARHNCRYLGTSVMKIKGNKSEALRDYPATDHPHLTVAISSQQSTIGHGSQNQLAYSDLHRPHLKCCQLHAAGVVLGMQLLQFPWERWGWMQWWCSRPVPADWAAR